MKKILCMALCLLMCFSSACAFAEGNSPDLSIVLQVGNPTMTVNGTARDIDQEGNVAPVIIDGRTLLPVRAVVDAMGGEVSWESDTQTAALICSGQEIRLVIGSTTGYFNGEAVTLDVAPMVLKDRTMLPIRFIAEGFGYHVDWKADTQEITLTNQGSGLFSVIIEGEDMELIQGGTFVMGSPADEAERYGDEVQHNVTVDSFYMARRELTQKDYLAVTGENPSENQGDDLPVENITWYDAIAYCNALSEMEGLTPCYTVTGGTVIWNKGADGYRLPTEAEWEYACRAGTQTPFSFGNYVDDSDANCYNAYGYNNNSSGSWVNGYLGHTVSVDSYPPNGRGLYNIHGNAAEWVWDWYGEYSADAVSNPTGPETGNYKIARGGGWNDMPKHIRSAYRSAFPADVPLYSIGMRLVRSAQPAEGTAASISTGSSEAKPGRVLIAYFSQTGNTDGLAQIIGEMTNADIFRIERDIPYSSTGNSQSLYAEALTEYREQAVPDLKVYLEDAGFDIAEYDTILLGYSNWWGSVPAPVRSFLTHYDLNGKTIIPFCSMGGGRFGQTISAVAKHAPGSTIKEGLDITYASYQRDRIKDWLTNSGIAAEGTD